MNTLNPETPSTLANRTALLLTGRDVCDLLQISPVTLWRLTARGLIRPNPYLRHKRYTRAEVDRFASGKARPEVKKSTGLASSVAAAAPASPAT